MYAHSRNLFRNADGTPMKFIVLSSSFDFNIVSSLIQWGGGSVSFKDEPVAGPINLSCKSLSGLLNCDVHNTSFVYACCLSNRMLDLEGFSLGGSQSSPRVLRIPGKSPHLTPGTKSEMRSSNVHAVESSGRLQKALLPGVASQNSPMQCSSGDTSAKEESSAEDATNDSLSPSWCQWKSAVWESSVVGSSDSEIWPEDSASMPKKDFAIGSSPDDDLQMMDQQSMTRDALLKLKVSKWLESPERITEDHLGRK